MKYEIAIPDGVIPEGWEPVAFRTANRDETIISTCGGKVTTGGTFAPRLILRKTWHWPEWLTSRFIFRDSAPGSTSWFATNRAPKRNEYVWELTGDIVHLSCHLFDFTPPECKSWKDSLHENPNWKGGAK